MPGLGSFRLPATALRRATAAVPRNHSVLNGGAQVRTYASRQTTQRLAKTARLTLIFGASAAVIYYYPTITGFISGELTEEEKKAEESAKLKPSKAEIKVQSKVPQTTIDAIPKSWDEPGVYLWGLNTNKVADPTSKEAYIRVPKRLKHFDGQLLRDVKLRHDFGAAVTEKGDVVQWGKGFDEKEFNPTTTLTGKDITKITVSSDRVIALSKKGGVYSIPASKADLVAGKKDLEAESASTDGSWLSPIWPSSNSSSGLSFRTITPSGLARGESVVDISSGTDHCLFLTNKGRVFAAASSTSEFPANGQMGIPGLRWETRPAGPYYQAHEIKDLKGVEATQIATGDKHSLVLAKDGSVYGFGDNMFGQLGMVNPSGTTLTEKPVKIPTRTMYGRAVDPKFTTIAAGGNNSFFSTLSPNNHNITDMWAAGQGHLGSLGTGRWLHMTSTPGRVKGLSGLTEYSDAAGGIVPITASQMSIGTTHAAAVLQGAAAPDKGHDVVVWGGNEHFQLGTGKRTNLNAPTNIPPTDVPEDVVLLENQRMQVAPRRTVTVGGKKGRKVTLTQKIECGEYVSALYSTPA
ncbi:hypothetical protein TD95_000523 [Thielaviopsis punctulata]|uniref:Uncharacterized protein n=1 Tax=Thielaviopsis punctulata TaxID=72032 RepID=A0A0F4Z911_9PEZI|nr:hypothetical protein TD95_000523 [Thielaviopsis punctulata]